MADVGSHLGCYVARGPWAGAYIAVLRGLGAEGSTMPTTELTPSEIAEELRAIEGQLESLEERFAEVVDKVNSTIDDLQFAAHKLVVALDRGADA
jgi:hypothetical protein